MHLALELKVFLAALIAVSLVAAAVVRPPPRPQPGLTGLVLGASLTVYALSAALLFSGSSGAGLVALVLASEGMCVTAWLGRAIITSEGDDDDDTQSNPRRPRDPDGEQLDWPMFESLRRSWSKESSSRSSETDD